MTTMYLTYSPHNQINIKHFINKWNSYLLEVHHIPGYSDLNQKECLNWKKKPKIYWVKMKGLAVLCLQNVMRFIFQMKAFRSIMTILFTGGCCTLVFNNLHNSSGSSGRMGGGGKHEIYFYPTKL